LRNFDFGGHTIRKSGKIPRQAAKRRRSQYDIHLAQRHPLKLFVAEDDRVNRRLIMALLRRLGWEPTAARNGRI